MQYYFSPPFSLSAVYFCQVYMDGTLDGAVSGSGYTSQMTTEKRLILGADCIGDTYPYILATVDELKIYERALNCREVMKLYESYA